MYEALVPKLKAKKNLSFILPLYLSNFGILWKRNYVT